MSTDPKGGFYAAFPVPETFSADGRLPANDTGMSIRQYAAIHLRVPKSGDAWLDEMIREAQRNEFAARTLTALAPQDIPWTSIAKSALVAANAMCERLNAPTN